MSSPYRTSTLNNLLTHWASWLFSNAAKVVALIAALTACSLYYASQNLGIDTNTQHMLSPDLPFQRNFANYQKRFPQTADTLVILVEATTPDRARQATNRLVQQLKRRNDLFRQVYQPFGGQFLDKQALLYLQTDELQTLASRLSEVQPLLATLTRNMSLDGLFSMLDAALTAVEDGEQLELQPLLNQLSAAFSASVKGNYYEVSWQRLIQGDNPDQDGQKQLIILQPRLDYSQLKPAQHAIAAIRELASTLNLDQAHGVRLQLTGEVALAYDELETASRGALFTGLLSLGLVASILIIGLRSWQLISAAVITLVTGLIWTSGFAALAIGSLNLISIAFAVLYIGLGIDYSIHLCLRYQELTAQQVAKSAALQTALGDIGRSLLICTITTATGFYAFIPTSFAGVSELGLIAGTGMVISLILNLSLLPALLYLFPLQQAARQPKAGNHLASVLLPFTSHPRPVLLAALATAVIAALLLPSVRFDANPLHLRDAQSESVRTFNKLLKSSNSSPWSIALTVQGRDKTARRVALLKESPVVGRVVSIEQFIPDHQQDKIAILQDLALILGAELSATEPVPVSEPEKQIKALEKFQARLDHYRPTDNISEATLNNLKNNLQAWLQGLKAQGPEQQTLRLTHLQQSLLGTLPLQLQQLNTALTAQPVQISTLPESLARRWLTDNGVYRIEVQPKKTLDTDADLQEFVTAVQAIAPEATESAVYNLEAGKVVVKAFKQALLLAFSVITILLLVFMPHKQDVVLVLVPLLLAAAITGALTVLLNLPFNYANVIALPLLLGVGVDSGIHMVHRFRTTQAAEENLLGSSTTQAVLLSTLTTICSFGSLAFSPHPGAASMGKMLSIGIGATLVCVLIVLPALLYWRKPAG